jgi:hypothetical protein
MLLIPPRKTATGQQQTSSKLSQSQCSTPIDSLAMTVCAIDAGALTGGESTVRLGIKASD